MLRAWMSVASLAVGFALSSTSPADAYRIVARLPSTMDGQPLGVVRFDPTSHRLFAGNSVGLYAADLSAAKPQMAGPIAEQHGIAAIDVAPDLARVFYAAASEIGYLDGHGGRPVNLAELSASALAYEPSRREIYAATSVGRTPYMVVLDALTGQLRQSIELSGEYAFDLQAIPGTVFFLLAGAEGIYAIDARTHDVAPWRVTGPIVTPGNLEADPAGRFLFLARSREIDAIEVSSRKVVGRVPMYGTASIAFDPSSNLLIAAWPDLSASRDELALLRPTSDGLTQIGTIANDAGGTSIVRTNYGFIQRDDHEFLIWSAQGPGRTGVDRSRDRVR